LIASAVRSASAAMVKVGLAVRDVGKSEEPENQRLRVVGNSLRLRRVAPQDG
jgi:hypothetical protein